MRLLQPLLALVATTAIASPVADSKSLLQRNPDALHSSPKPSHLHQRSPREEEEAALEERYAELAFDHDAEEIAAILEKRKGGGGGRGGGGGGSTGGRSGGGSGGGGRPVSSYSFSPQNSAGGRTISGSGPPPAYAGGRYAGGATVPYTAGARSPTRGIAPYAFPLAGFAVFPGIFLFGAYAYPYGYGYHYYQDGQNHTANVTCLCGEYQVCGCDPDGNQTVLADQIANGTEGGPPVNTSTVRTVQYDNGTEIAYINGSLPNGTTAPGGTEPSDESQISAAVQQFMSYAGYWLMVVTVGWGVYMGGLP